MSIIRPVSGLHSSNTAPGITRTDKRADTQLSLADPMINYDDQLEQSLAYHSRKLAFIMTLPIGAQIITAESRCTRAIQVKAR